MDLKEFLEKSVSFGLGLAAFSQEKVEELVEDMVKRGEVAQKDARSFAGDLVRKGEEQRAEIRRMIREEIAAALKELNLKPAGEVEQSASSGEQDR